MRHPGESLLDRWWTERAESRSSLVPRALATVVLGVAYFATARLSLRFALVEHNVTPLWPPTGIAVVAFLVLGRWSWPGIAVAALLVNVPISDSLWAAALTAAGNTLAPLVASWLLSAVGFRREIDRLRDAVAIVFLGALGSMLISATVGAGALVLSGAIRGHDYLGAWAVWWTGDAMGVLVVAPFLLSLFLFRLSGPISWRRWLEAVGLFVALAVVANVVVRSHLQLLFLVVPLLVWVTWRFQQRGAAPAALLVAGVATWAAAKGLGPFADGTLFAKMLKLQAFNATVAITSFVFAAVVAERMQAREELEAAAQALEERVRDRTSDLSVANERLKREIAERRLAERKLRQQGRQLQEAQEMARIGSWEWLIPEDRVTWSDEMYRIYGHAPQSFSVRFADAVAQILDEDLPAVRANVESALRKGSDHELPVLEYRIRHPDGAERTLVGKARIIFDSERRPLRMLGTVQDVSEGKQAQREHRIAEMLQRVLLPERLPEIPGISLAARYVPATSDVEVGGDWYDVMQLPNGNVSVAIGDVAGHGLQAASIMGQLRMALRAYATEPLSPGEVVRRVHQLVQNTFEPEIASLIYLVVDPETSIVTFANAGHPPPLLIPPNGPARYVEEALAPPLGAASSSDSYVEASLELPSDWTLLLFTDGLIERRGSSLERGLDRLREEAGVSSPTLDSLCDRLLGEFLGSNVADDVALLAVRPIPFGAGGVRVRLPAEPHVLAPMRRTLRRWLREIHATPQESDDIVAACHEACANAIVHPYGGRVGQVELSLELTNGVLDVEVRDSGRWRESAAADGHGLRMMRGFMDSVVVEADDEGTVVRMRRELRARANAPAMRPELEGSR